MSDFVWPMDCSHQTPLSVGFFLLSPAVAARFFTTSATWEATVWL